MRLRLKILLLLLLAIILTVGYREWAFLLLLSHPGGFPSALEALEKARELYPASPKPLVLEGEIYLSRGFYDYAEKVFSLAVEMGGGAEALAGLGDALFARGKKEEALAAWLRALEIMPYDPTLHRKIGLALFKEGKFHAAAFHLEEADDPCLLALALAPINPAEAARLAESCQGFEGLKSILAIPDEPLRLRELGKLYVAMGEYGAAKAVLEESLAIYPESPEGWAFLGHALSRLGLDPSQAFAKSLELDYTFALGHYFWGVHLLTQGDLEKGKRELLYALSLEPSNPYFQAALAEVEIQRGNYQEAEERLKKAVELAPEEPSFRLSLGELQIAILMRTDKEALENIQKVIELSPAEPKAWELAGMAYYYAGQSALAEDYLKKALDLSPDSPRALYYLGLVYLLEGEKSKAQGIFRRIQEVAPASIWAQRAYWAERR